MKFNIILLLVTIIFFILNVNLIFGDPLILTRNGGISNEFRSLEIDTLTGFYFNQANHKGKISNEELKIIQNILDNDAFKQLKPKYLNPLDVTSYRYTISLPSKKSGSSVDVTADYPKFLDSIFSIFEFYSS
ncbi:hypothetical protein DDB_G0272464 [Dictyostelium discoideum AX4]|uniref:Uncharacterized protein n=1 Tax=Dictyostelium discoideum TaxID=44689 RepID=Q75JX2_DICDI|nr:hypothetical protein DDB_G0272464 [Dictyostelium discoideum AX4]EAL71384.1 hypothetical protein DDB_G0272464 [Dictyostelium discoideum AX4]|eukprot:XP_645295.1 hypothetical protein DDB_G0272464 [Dictyostelium discoideum AX4]